MTSATVVASSAFKAPDASRLMKNVAIGVRLNSSRHMTSAVQMTKSSLILSLGCHIFDVMVVPVSRADRTAISMMVRFRCVGLKRQMTGVKSCNSRREGSDRLIITRSQYPTGNTVRQQPGRDEDERLQRDAARAFDRIPVASPTNSLGLADAGNPSVVGHVDAQRGRVSWQAGHRADFTCERINKPGSRGKSNVPDRDPESARASELRRIMGK